MLPYTVEEITARVTPVAKKYGLAAVYLFGSYARGEADAGSDVDLLVDVSGTGIDTLLKLGGLYNDRSILLPLIQWKHLQIAGVSFGFVKP